MTPTLQLPPELAKQHLVVPCPEQVGAYLGQHSELIDLLPPLCSRAREEFGPESELSLEVYHDPEIKDHYLTLYVRQPAYDRTIIERIEALSALYDKDLTSRSGQLLITTDFTPPRKLHGV